MKKNIIKTTAIALTGLAMALSSTSCSDERDLAGNGEGQLMMSFAYSSQVKKHQKGRVTAQEEAELAEKAIVWISNPKGAVRKYNGLAEVPVGGIRLLTDHYVAEVWTGDSASASFDKKWFKGREEFDIVKDQTTNVTITASIANSVVSVEYEATVDELLKDYTMTVGHKRGDLVFEGRDDRMGYFMMPSSDKNLKWNLQGKLGDGTVYTRSGVIENAKPATHYTIHVGYTQENPEIGGGYFTIEIEEETITVEDEVTFKLAPQFKGYNNLKIEEDITGEVGKFSRKSVLVEACDNLTSLILEGSMFNAFLSGADVDLFNMEPSVAQALQNAGLTFTYTYNDETESSVTKVNFEETLLNILTEGEYPVKLTATDSNGKFNSTVIKFVASDAPARVEDAVATDIWAGHATVTGRVLKADAQNPGISYRKKGEIAWTAATTTVTGTAMTATITGLEPGTEYEYTATATDYVSAAVKSFTTEAATQLPNAGFESWQDSKTPYLVYGAGEEMFWDTGNHGSQKMSKNVTVPATDKFHSGSRSIKLCSQFVGVGIIGKFAAGNVFVGKYLDTDGTDGVLGWGRTWASRPTKLKGWIHYTPAAITDKASNCPAAVEKGDMDTGIIYIAILDGTTEEYKGENFPVIIKTKASSLQLFNKDADNVIAYGELILTEATNGDAMVEFTIPLTYKRTDAKAQNIMITASASRYGDYFTGGPSNMYIDDLELVYE